MQGYVWTSPGVAEDCFLSLKDPPVLDGAILAKKFFMLTGLIQDPACN